MTARSADGSVVAVVGQLPPPLHGSAVMTGRLIETLRAEGHDVAVVDRRFSRSVDEVGRAGVRKVLAVPSLAARFVAAGQRSDVLVLLVTTTPASFLIDSLLLALSRKPVVHYVHTVGFTALSRRGPLWERLVRRALGRAVAVVVLGPSLVADIAPFVSADRIVVIPNSTPAAGAVDREPGARVLFLSNLLPGKGADVFVRTARELQRRRPDVDWRFDLAGAGDVVALGPLPSCVEAHGRVVGDAKRALLDGADVLVVPSTYALEAQPLVIIEALAHGVAVVAYDNGGIRDLVDDSVGALVPVGDEEALASAVAGLIGDRERLRAARMRAVERHRAVHAPAVFAESWRVLLGDGVRGNARSASAASLSVPA